MLRLLPGDSAPRIRLLGKFVEKDYEKISKLVQLRREYATKVAAVDASIEKDGVGLSAAEREDLADEWLSRRLDAGLFCLQVRSLAKVIIEQNTNDLRRPSMLSSLG